MPDDIVKINNFLSERELNLNPDIHILNIPPFNLDINVPNDSLLSITENAVDLDLIILCLNYDASKLSNFYNFYENISKKYEVVVYVSDFQVDPLSSLLSETEYMYFPLGKKQNLIEHLKKELLLLFQVKISLENI